MTNIIQNTNPAFKKKERKTRYANERVKRDMGMMNQKKKKATRARTTTKELGGRKARRKNRLRRGG
jgi:hypothetical protein